MMNSRALACALAIFFLSTFAHANNEAIVRKSDGSVSNYKLLPVHLDPSHARIVEERVEYTLRDLPKSYQIERTKLPAMRDQGQRGTCVYFATVGLIESNLIAQDPENAKTKVSEQCLVGLRNWEHDDKAYTGDDKPVGFRPDPDGDELDLVAKTAAYYGVPQEAKYPKMNCRYSYAGDSKPTPLDLYETVFTSGESKPYAKGLNFVIDKAPTIEKIKEQIANGNPVEVATLVYRDHFNTSSWDYNGMDDNPNTLAGGHAILLTGYRTSGHSTYFTFKNSWGNWGAGGYGIITDRLLRHSWKSDPDSDVIVTIQ